MFKINFGRKRFEKKANDRPNHLSWQETYEVHKLLTQMFATHAVQCIITCKINLELHRICHASQEVILPTHYWSHHSTRIRPLHYSFRVFLCTCVYRYCRRNQFFLNATGMHARRLYYTILRHICFIVSKRSTSSLVVSTLIPRQ